MENKIKQINNLLAEKEAKMNELLSKTVPSDERTVELMKATLIRAEVDTLRTVLSILCQDNLTANETMVLTKIMERSNFNCDTIDLTKDWKHQSLEDPEQYWGFADTKDFGCGLSKQAARAIFGSLSKKGLINVWKEDDANFSWLTIDEECFNNIKKALA